MPFPIVGRNPSPQIGRNPSERLRKQAAPLWLNRATVVDPGGVFDSITEEDDGSLTLVINAAPLGTTPDDGGRIVWDATSTDGREVEYPLTPGGLVLDVLTPAAAPANVHVGLFFSDGEAMAGNYFGGSLDFADAGATSTPNAWRTGGLMAAGTAGANAQMHISAAMMANLADVDDVVCRGCTAYGLDALNAGLGRGVSTAAINWANATPDFKFVLSAWPYTGASGTTTVRVRPYTHWLASRVSRGVR